MLNGHAVIVGHLRGTYKKRMSEEIKASGIDAEVSEIDTIIEDLVEKNDAAIANDNNEKKKVEAEKKVAEEIRNKAMELYGQTSKRSEEERGKSKKRKSGSEAVEFLR